MEEVGGKVKAHWYGTMGAIFAIMRELNLSLFTFRYRGHMVDYTAAHCALHSVSFYQIQSGFMYGQKSLFKLKMWKN